MTARSIESLTGHLRRAHHSLSAAHPIKQSQPRHGSARGKTRRHLQDRRPVAMVHAMHRHHHANCPRATIPNTNLEFWRAKFALFIQGGRFIYHRR